jgi:deoxyribose-phosphate aldolase
MDKKLNKYIDHTVLAAFATETDVARICAEAKKYDFASVCINPMYVAKAKDLLEGSDVNVCTVIGFPLGANATSTKVAETEQAYIDGCEEFDMVIAVGALKEGKLDYVRDDIAAVVKAAKGKTVKVIIETAYLTDEEKITACKLSAEAGAHFVKTCTGFSNAKDAENKATVHDIKLMKASIPASMQVKASGGIRSYEDAMALIEAGADRLGTSAGVKIVEG